MAETEVASLVTRLSADVSGLEKGLRDADGDVGDFAKKTGNRLSDLGGKFIALGAATAPITAGLALSAKAAIDWESQFAGVVKTVDATDSELAILAGNIRDMATMESPVSALDNAHETLATIAESGGALGVATEDLEKFTSKVAMLDVASDLTADSAATFVAQFSNVAGLDIGDNVGSIADTVVTLGNNLAATESDVAAFGNRLSPLATFQWDPQDILAYGGAMASLGVSAELGGTNILKSVGDMTTAVALGGPALQGYADIAGTTADEFTTLAETDPEGAFRSFIEGLGKLDASEQILQLNELGITSNEQITTLQRLAGGFGVLTDALGLAEDAWSENGAAEKEAAARARTLAGRMSKLQNNMRDFAITIGDHLTPVIGVFVDGLTGVVSGLNKFGQENPIVMRGLVAFAGFISVAGTALIGLGGAMMFITPLLGALGVGLGALIAPVLLVGAGFAALVALGPEIANAFSTMDFSGLANKITSAISGIQIGDSTVGELAIKVKDKITEALDGITINGTELVALPGMISTAVSDAVNGASGGDFNTLTVSISGKLTDAIADVQNTQIDTAAISAWADTNMNSILDTVVSVAGIVFGGPIGLAIGAANLIGKAIESDFLGIGTFLQSSGIAASVETAFNDLKSTIEGVIAAVFGGGEPAFEVGPAAFDFTGVESGGGMGVLGKFGQDLKKGVDGIKGILEGITPGITEGLTALGDGVTRFISGIMGAETEGLYDAFRPVLAVIGGFISAGIALAGFGIGTTFEAIGNVLGPLGEAIGGIITTVSRLGEGDLTGAFESFIGAIADFGESLTAFPITVVDNVIEKVNEIFGLQLPDVATAFQLAATGIRVGMDSVFRAIRIGGLQIELEITRIMGTVRALGAKVGLNLFPDLDAQVSEKLTDMAQLLKADQIASALTQQTSGGVLDLGQLITVEVTDPQGMVHSATMPLSEALASPTTIAAMGEGGKIAIEDALKLAFATADVSDEMALIPAAVQLGLDPVAIKTQVEADAKAAAESATPSATISLTAVANVVSDVASQVNTFISGLPFASTVSAMIQVNPIISFLQDVGSLIGDALSGLPGGGAVAAPPGAPIKPFATGTPFVQREGLAYLHAGERVMTAAENKAYSGGGRAPIVNNYYVSSYGQSAHELNQRLQRESKNGAR